MVQHAYRAALALVICLFLATLSATSAAAQELVSGRWAGTVEPPEGGVFDVEFVVEGAEHPTITLVFQGERRPMEDVDLSEGVLRFGWLDGVRIECELTPTEEGGFGGICAGDDGQAGHLTMTPPS